MFSTENGANSVVINSLPAGSSSEVRMSYTSRAGIAQGSYKINIKEQYDSPEFKNAEESNGCDGRIVIRTTAGPPVLEVTDNGPGIDKDTASKLFSPFFSTKPNGQGIGLMLVREVLLNHHCTFSLRTGEDGLTRFRICFPTGAC